MLITKFIHTNPRADNIMKFDFVYFAEKCGCRSWRFLLSAAINWPGSSLRTPAVHYTVNWRLFTSIWIYSHPTECCFSFLLLPALRMIFKCAFWVICLVAALVASRWTNWCLRFCCVPMSDALDVAHANRLDLDPLSPGWGGCVSMICWCGIWEEDDNEKKWEVLRTI